MIIDASALLAILQREPERRPFLEAIASAEMRRLSAATYLEAGIVVDMSGRPIARASLDRLLERLGITVEPVTASQARIAREAYRNFGRGSGHPARLNYGDCFAYALARELDEPILYKGTDFGSTDIRYAGRRSERRRLSELIPAYG